MTACCETFVAIFSNQFLDFFGVLCVCVYDDVVSDFVFNVGLDGLNDLFVGLDECWRLKLGDVTITLERLLACGRNVVGE